MTIIKAIPYQILPMVLHQSMIRRETFPPMSKAYLFINYCTTIRHTGTNTRHTRQNDVSFLFNTFFTVLLKHEGKIP